tara:strand:- start:1180 stop:1479 length:300 start_codon:yes stop_codon:yes gene_type:complete
MVKKEDEKGMYTISRQDLARIEEFDVQWYEFFGSWIRVERSDETDDNLMVSVHKDEDSDYISKMVVNKDELNVKDKRDMFQKRQDEVTERLNAILDRGF